jgi:hypothetical protein
MIEFFKTVFMWTGFITLYMAVVVGIAKLLKSGRINAFGPDCAICGYDKISHEYPGAPDFYVDPAMYPCDTYERGE